MDYEQTSAAIIAAAIALSSYLAIVRFRLHDHDRKEDLIALVFPDVMFCVSFLLLFIARLIHAIRPFDLSLVLFIGAITFGAGAVWLIVLHFFQWRESWKHRRRKKDRSDKPGPVRITCDDSEIQFTISGSNTKIQFRANKGTITAVPSPPKVSGAGVTPGAGQP